MIKNDQHGFFKFLSILLLLLKIPTFFAVLVSLRRQGGNLGLSFADSSGPTGTRAFFVAVFPLILLTSSVVNARRVHLQRKGRIPDTGRRK